MSVIRRHDIQTAAVLEPVSLDECKEHLVIADGETVDDALLIAHRAAAREQIESYTRKRFINQTLDFWMDAFPAENWFELSPGPLSSITHIKTFDTSDTEATMSSADYIVDTTGNLGRIMLRDGASWPSTSLRTANGIQVRAVVGYGAGAGDSPESLRLAALHLVAHWYENREPVIAAPGVTAVELPDVTRRIASPYREDRR
jgi:uncharacterized phiE125 gp8 family phage protein